MNLWQMFIEKTVNKKKVVLEEVQKRADKNGWVNVNVQEDKWIDTINELIMKDNYLIGSVYSVRMTDEGLKYLGK